MPEKKQFKVWFSCGAASAVAAKVVVERYGCTDEVEVCYCDLLTDEHPDNRRFLNNVETWIGRKVTMLKHPKYSSIFDVFLANSYLVGPAGAPCTKHLKRRVREAYQKEGDIHVFGLTADEQKRIKQFEDNNPNIEMRFILAEAGITKADCYKIIQSAGIELPEMYKLGFNNNNCVGCVKGGKGYWNKIRRHFPDRFKQMAEIERFIGATILRNPDGTRLYLDELDPDAGRDVPEPDIECGVTCVGYEQLIQVAVLAGSSNQGCEA